MKNSPNSTLQYFSTIRVKARAAFTLMEVMLAIAMISLLAILVVSNVDKLMTSSQAKIAESFVNGSLATPMMAFKLSTGRYPTTEEGLNALLKAPDSLKERWDGPYVRNLPADPWGNPYQDRCPAQKSADGYDLWSMGQDGQNNTDDDIGNWKN